MKFAIPMAPGLNHVRYVVPLMHEGVEIGTVRVDYTKDSGMHISAELEAGDMNDKMKEFFLSYISIAIPGVQRLYQPATDTFRPVTEAEYNAMQALVNEQLNTQKDPG